jgi:hypothetical protein
MPTHKQSPAAPGYILVHPHFSPDSLPELSFSSPLRQVTQRTLNEDLAHLTSGSSKALELALRNEHLNQFYRAEIDAIAQNSTAKLLILRSTFDWRAEQDNQTEWSAMERRAGLTGERLKALCEALYKLQDETIAYAAAKLGDRLCVTDSDPDDIAPEVMKFFGQRMRLEIFGETRDVCVKDAHRAMKEDIEAEINEVKCPV